MKSKYVATIDFTSLHALKTFVGIIKEAGGNVSSISGDRPNTSSMLNNPIIIPNKSETIFNSDIKIYASSTIDLENAKEVFKSEIGEKNKKSAASTLLESVSNFRGYATSAK